jgi:2-oxoisovalerate dehydrogenase E2 component (dihydrolipoyl transacylase)
MVYAQPGKNRQRGPQAGGVLADQRRTTNVGRWSLVIRRWEEFHTMPVEIVMPQLGESIHEGTVGKWLKKVGEPVKKYEPLLEVITDKVDSEITATDSGVLLEIRVPEGETVKVGTVLAVLGQPGEKVPSGDGQQAVVPTAPAEEAGRPHRERISPVVARIAAEHEVDLSQVSGTGAGGRITKEDVLHFVEERDRQAAAALPVETPRPVAAPPPVEEGKVRFISPAVARLAAEHQVDLSQVQGTGAGGRVTKQDVLAYVEQREEAPKAPPVPSAPAAPMPAVAPGDQEVPLSPKRKAIAEHMVRSKQLAPHVTTVMEADLSQVEAIRAAQGAEFQRREGFSLTYMPFIVQAVVAALRAHPRVNSVFAGDRIVLKGRVNIGIAVAVEDGLIVPVVRDADEKSFLKLAREIRDVAVRAREKRLVPDDVQGSTFTITNHGGSGSLFATPIINQPNVAILGVGTVQKRAVVTPDDAIAIRPMCYLSLTFDHRVLDGVAADEFLAEVKRNLEQFSGSI